MAAAVGRMLGGLAGQVPADSGQSKPPPKKAQVDPLKYGAEMPI